MIPFSALATASRLVWLSSLDLLILIGFALVLQCLPGRHRWLVSRVLPAQRGLQLTNFCILGVHHDWQAKNNHGFNRRESRLFP